MLRCPEPHEESFCVVAPDAMVGRSVWRGVVGCPVCRKEFPIRDGVAEFGPIPPARLPDSASSALPEAEVVAALLGLGGPGGYLVLLGSAVRLVPELGQWLGGVHFVGINAPPDAARPGMLSLLTCERKIPLRASMARGVVIGPDFAVEPWIGEAVRVVLEGLRVVVIGGELGQVEGLVQLAAGRGMWVGEKTGSGGGSRKEGQSA